jgi:hypothetical protein
MKLKKSNKRRFFGVFLSLRLCGLVWFFLMWGSQRAEAMPLCGQGERFLMGCQAVAPATADAAKPAAREKTDSAGSAKAATPTKQAAKRRYLGDVVLRIDAGVQFLRFSDASGEGITETIGTRSVDTLLHLEYGYFLRERFSILDQTVLFLALPFGIDYDFIVGPLITMQIGLGVRQFWSIFFLDFQLLLTLFKRSLFRFEFGGVLIGVGAAIPIHERVRLTITTRVLGQYNNGIRIGLNGLVGIETLF